MRIGIDARPFKYSEFSGIPLAIYEVIKRWIVDYPEHEYFLISNSDIKLPCDLPDNWKKIIVPAVTGNGTLWQVFRLHKVVKKLKLDVFWGTNFLLPRKVSGCKFVLTVHDLAFEIMPEVVSKKTLMILRLFCKKACRDSDIIHSVSESTKRDIIEKYNISEEKIRVVYWGAPKDAGCDAHDADNNVKNLDYDFMLVLGTLEPRKNIVTIARAFDEFKKSDRKGIHIVYAGKWGWKYDEFKHIIDSSKYKEHIHILDFVDEHTKQILLKKARLLLYPSLYEGFGIPILEAYRCGLPVITTNESSIPEVAGKAAYYITNPHDYSEMAHGMMNVLGYTDLELNKYKQMMRIQLDRFSWEKCSCELNELMTEGK